MIKHNKTESYTRNENKYHAKPHTNYISGGGTKFILAYFDALCLLLQTLINSRAVTR